ncbi:hypothetical protein Poly21_41090 [Allorhodopirellula heiligendammensis]|uniref:Uncharacterized protein n=1 Tax=Allorhodopirellula heiligendammensis TaxID=2714739 RepID=A0A5C6BZV3_9BACT|nr:hypothetical protein Poly21_41090 [Allorhodopirellula heiligendammensis]
MYGREREASTAFGKLIEILYARGGHELLSMKSTFT